jgi:hypothetical protein
LILLTWEEAKKCGYVPQKGDPAFDPTKPPPEPCKGEGKVMSTGTQARFKIRYVECQVCHATWQVVFLPPPPPEEMSRTKAERK